jgi:hypothetical protein
MKHIPLKEWKSILTEALNSGNLQIEFDNFTKYYNAHRAIFSEAEQCAFNQIGYIYQEKLKEVKND